MTIKQSHRGLGNQSELRIINEGIHAKGSESQIRKLTKDDRTQVARAAQDRNVIDCVNGSEDCDRSQLGVDEQRDAANAAHDNRL
jgi:hypothetical protein